MKRIMLLALVMVLLTGFSGPIPASALQSAAAPAALARTYTVLVGAENANKGIDVEGYFPAVLHIHAGDTVTWKRNTNEIHTVTFLGNVYSSLPDLLVPLPLPGAPAGAMMINPLAGFPSGPTNGMYNGKDFVNSGIFGADPGMVSSFSLTFTAQGTFSYVCFVHGVEMSGTIVVDASTIREPSPADVSAKAKWDIASALKHGNAVYAEGMEQVRKSTKNPDGTTTHYVTIGYMKGNIDIMAFFPNKIKVEPGDMVVWTVSNTDSAPHTVTFLNGNPDPSLILAITNPADPTGLPFLAINPAVAAPQNMGQALTRSGVFSSGLLLPVAGLDMYGLTIGNIHGKITFQCLLHDASGMVGSLIVGN
jgi:plastocyanin